MTDEAKKIVDALKSCNNQNDCRNCVYDKIEGDCVENMEYAAIKLIEKQNAEIEELKNRIADAMCAAIYNGHEAVERVEKLRNENEELRNQVYNLTLYLKCAAKAANNIAANHSIAFANGIYGEQYTDIIECMKDRYDGMPGYNPAILEVRNEAD